MRCAVGCSTAASSSAKDLAVTSAESRESRGYDPPVREPTVAPEQLPPCTVVIPTRRRAHLLRECLLALAASDYPSTKLEVIVVDDDAHRATRAAVDESRDVLDVSLCETDRRGPAAARNTGA